jgi:hypothetical protein
VAEAAWQATTSWCHHHQDKLQNSVHHLIPQRKKYQLKVSGVKDIRKMEMVHYKDVTLALSACLLAAQRVIYSLCIRLQNTDATI